MSHREPFESDDRDYCPLARDELEELLRQSNWGVDKALFEKFFVTVDGESLLPPRCIECQGLIMQHEYSDPNKRLALAMVGGVDAVTGKGGNGDDPFSDASADAMRTQRVAEHMAAAANDDRVPTAPSGTPDEMEHFRRGDGPCGIDILKHSSLTYIGAALAVLFFAGSIAAFIYLAARDQINSPILIVPVLLMVICIVCSFLPSRRVIAFDRGTKEIRLEEIRFAVFCCAATDTIPFRRVIGVSVHPPPPPSSYAALSGSSKSGGVAGILVPDYDEDEEVSMKPASNHRRTTTSTFEPSGSASTHEIRLCFRDQRSSVVHSILLETTETVNPVYAERWWINYLQNDLNIVPELKKKEKAVAERRERDARRTRDAGTKGRWG